MRFLFGTLPFTMREYDNLEHPAQEQKERCTTIIGFEFHRCLKNSATTFQAVVRQPSTTNPIDSPARSPIGTPSMTIGSFRLALSEIRTTKPDESSMIERSNREAVNSSSKYPTINRTTMIKCGSSSSGRTPPQPIHQHDPTAGLSLCDKSGLSLQNWCALSDRQAMHRRLKKNIFLPN
jgi:hypothetical protein